VVSVFVGRSIYRWFLIKVHLFPWLATVWQPVLDKIGDRQVLVADLSTQDSLTQMAMVSRFGA